MKRLGLLVAVAIALVPAQAFAVVSLGGSTIWSNLADGVGTQFGQFLGDMGPMAMLIIGAGLVLLVIGAVVTMVVRR